VILIADKGGSNGIQKIRCDTGILENLIHQIEEAVSLVVGIGVNPSIWIGRATSTSGITIEATPTLSVLKDHDFAGEDIRMIEYSLHQPPNQIGIGASSVFPLRVDFDQDHIVGSYDA
jgi:hypothetical protein